jgi:hypothetical protein
MEFSRLGELPDKVSSKPSAEGEPIEFGRFWWLGDYCARPADSANRHSENSGVDTRFRWHSNTSLGLATC